METQKRQRLLSLLKENVLDVLGWQIQPDYRSSDEPHQANTITLQVNTGKKMLTLGIEYKNVLLDALLPVHDKVDIAIVAAPHIGKTMMERLKANRVSAFDETGNYSFFYRNGKERIMLCEFGHRPQTKRPPRIDAFSPKAGYVAMALLTAEGFEIGTLRDLQAQTALSLGGIYAICEAMKRQELIDYSRSKSIRILNPKRFLDEWAAYYSLRLAPKLTRVGYRLATKTIDSKTGETLLKLLDWKQGVPVLFNALPQSALTGVQAAQSVSRYYSLDTAEVLVSDLQTAEMQLRRHCLLTKTLHSPDIVLVAPYNSSAFMFMNEQAQLRTANPIQIYLDLISSEDQRANELGEIYREKALGY